jgi:hypothetical protein
MEPQAIYASTAGYNYLMDFAEFDLTFHEIPKNGSSTIKRLLLNALRGAPPEAGLHVGHRRWQRQFPKVVVRDHAAYTPRRHRLVVVRDPVKRVTSAYRNIWLGRMGRQGSFRDFFEGPWIDALGMPPTAYAENHFKPQSWFVPPDTLAAPGLIVLRTDQLGQFPKVMRQVVGRDVGDKAATVNRSEPALGVIDMDEAEIAARIADLVPGEYPFVEQALARLTLVDAAPAGPTTA